MKRQILKACVVVLLLGWSKVFAASVTPVVADYRDVIPTLDDIALNVHRTTDDGPWFVRFNLLTPANVAIGVDGRESCGLGCEGSFILSSIRLTDFDNPSVTFAFGTDSFQNNPFDPTNIDQLVTANNLAPDTYALAVSGSGNITGSGVSDFVTRLQVAPVPLPAALWFFLSGIIGLLAVKRKAKN